jgi:hypothetical protein
MENTIVHCVVGVDKYDGPILSTLKIYSKESDAFSYKGSLQHQIDNREIFGIHYVSKISREVISPTQ